MVFRSSAAICGAAITLAVSVVMARSEIDRGHSNAVAKAASGAAIVGAASMYNPYRPGWQEGGPNTASGERYDPSAWAAAIQISRPRRTRKALIGDSIFLAKGNLDCRLSGSGALKACDFIFKIERSRLRGS